MEICFDSKQFCWLEIVLSPVRNPVCFPCKSSLSRQCSGVLEYPGDYKWLSNCSETQTGVEPSGMLSRMLDVYCVLAPLMKCQGK